MRKIEVNVAGTKQIMDESQYEERAKTAVRLTLRAPRHRHAMQKNIEALDKIDDAETRINLEEAMKNATVSQLNQTFDEFKAAKDLAIAPEHTKLAETFFENVKDEANIVGSSRGAALFAGKFTSRAAAVIDAIPLVNILTKPLIKLGDMINKAFGSFMGDTEINKNNILNKNNAIFAPKKVLEDRKTIETRDNVSEEEAQSILKTRDAKLMLALAKSPSKLSTDVLRALHTAQRNNAIDKSRSGTVQVKIDVALAGRDQDFDPEFEKEFVEHYISSQNSSGSNPEGAAALIANPKRNIPTDGLKECARDAQYKNIQDAIANCDREADQEVLQTLIQNTEPKDISKLLNGKYFSNASDDVRKAVLPDLIKTITEGDSADMNEISDRVVDFLLTEGTDEQKTAAGLAIAGRDGALTKGAFEKLIKLDEKNKPNHKIRIALAENPRDYSEDQIKKLKGRNGFGGLVNAMRRHIVNGVSEALERREEARQERSDAAKNGTAEEQLEKAQSTTQLEESIHHAIIDAGDYNAVKALLNNPKQGLSKTSFDKCASHENPYIRIAFTNSKRDEIDTEQMKALLKGDDIDKTIQHPRGGSEHNTYSYQITIGSILSDNRKDNKIDLDKEIIETLSDLYSSEIDKNLVARDTSLEMDVIDKIADRYQEISHAVAQEIHITLAENPNQPLSEKAFNILWKKSSEKTKIALAGCARDYSKAQKELIIKSAKAGLKEGASETDKAITEAWKKRAQHIAA